MRSICPTTTSVSNSPPPPTTLSALIYVSQACCDQTRCGRASESYREEHNNSTWKHPPVNFRHERRINQLLKCPSLEGGALTGIRGIPFPRDPSRIENAFDRQSEANQALLSKGRRAGHGRRVGRLLPTSSALVMCLDINTRRWDARRRL